MRVFETNEYIVSFEDTEEVKNTAFERVLRFL